MSETFSTVFSMVLPVLRIILYLSPIWLPILLLRLWWDAWLTYRRTLFITKKQPVLLEIRIPKETNKSPLAMELALNGFFSVSGEKTMKDRYIKGSVRAWFSLELVSIEGQVKFFIWTWKDHVKNIQNNLYAQYPNIEVIEVPDYTLAFLYDKDRADIYAVEFILAKPDAYPIKTYVDYGLDRDPKEEFKIDPITPVLEYLGGLGKGEQAWIQIIVRAHRDEGGIFAGFKGIDDFFAFIPAVKDRLSKKTDNWKESVQKEVDSIVKKRKIKDKSADEEEENGRISLTTFEKDTVTALERSVSKLPFDVGIRGLYLAEKDVFNPAHKGAINGVMGQYGTQHLNGFRPGPTTGYDYWYQDPTGKLISEMKREMFEAYRERGWFHPPYQEKHLPPLSFFSKLLMQTDSKRLPYVLNAEELATIFHFPGGVAQTPTFGRIESRKAEPPKNLPF
ncbi:MAG: hypothetical protein QG633_96 [Patescibacteria group bacterium]|jgi:hypothetical protein|nr:hypothetical protein [Patescibacteria group bacterium]